MKAVIRVASRLPGSDFNLKKIVHIDTHRVPIPVAGDQLYVDGIFLDVAKRCLTLGLDDVPEDDAEIELFATVDHPAFQDLERMEGWVRD